MKTGDDTKFYRFNPDAILKCTPQKQIELWVGLVARLDKIYDALMWAKEHCCNRAQMEIIDQMLTDSKDANPPPPHEKE